MKSKLLIPIYILSTITFIASLIIFIIDFGFSEDWKGLVSLLIGFPIFGASALLFLMGKLSVYFKNKKKIKLGKIIYSILLIISSITLLILMISFFIESWILSGFLIYFLLIILIIISSILILIFLNRR